MANFKFKQFSLSDEKSAMKIGTDAVLLGAWADCSSAKTILDIGSGCGIISLMLAQRSNAKIHGIEIYNDSTREAIENAMNSPWSERVSFENIAFQKFWKATKVKYDLIITNPPYFINSLKSPDQKRSIARHTDNLSYEDIIIGSKNILAETGKLCVVLPYNERVFFRGKALIENLYCTKLMQVKNNNKSSYKRVLMQFEFIKKPIIIEDLIIRNENNGYSEKYYTLTKDFHLNI
ncbi:MAG: methyltransferase [Saprospiraceae bacterium]|nr:methyltransferase [Saprospiraceae bacterium]